MRIILGKDVLSDDERTASINRNNFKKSKTVVINLMSSPGAGKTTLLEKTIKALASEFRIGVIEGDLATDLDANRIRAYGAQAIQINTQGGCHLDARMIANVLSQFNLIEIDILFIENVGNLVCPSGYDLGQMHNVSILSLPEGDDKILKYPVMFRRIELVILNKLDLFPYLSFDIEHAIRDLKLINPSANLIKLSAQTEDGLDEWLEWLRSAYQNVKGG